MSVVRWCLLSALGRIGATSNDFGGRWRSLMIAGGYGVAVQWSTMGHPKIVRSW